jgi:tRNA nucleotidyltransferase (CCA-adding enzyme)
MPSLVPLTPAAQSVLDAITSVGGKPLIVGGSVRDALLSSGESHIPKDIDIEVYNADVDNLIKTLRNIGKVDDVGRYFSVIKVTIGNEDFDISSPRTDAKTGEGHRGFDVTADHGLDEVTAFGRRDFTVNAMGWDPATHELVDPYGGTADLTAKVLRHTTAAFREDPLRVLRGVQFAGRFGFDIADETITECRDLFDTFSELPIERVWGEWEKIALKAPWPSKSLKALYDVGWESHFPELAAIRGVEQGIKWHPEGSVEVHSAMAADLAAGIAVRDNLSDEERLVVVFGALVHDFGKVTHSVLESDGRITSHGHAEAGAPVADAFMARLGAPNLVREHVRVIVREHMSHAGIDEPSKPAIRRLIRRLAGNGTGPSLEQWARVVEADMGARIVGSEPEPPAKWLEGAKNLKTGSRPPCTILRGEDLLARGLPQGPLFRHILDASIEAQDDEVFEDSVGANQWLDQWLIANPVS